jgi:predicted transcriptional regulator
VNQVDPEKAPSTEETGRLSETSKQMKPQSTEKPSINSIGDLMLTDPQAMLALASPGRLTLLGQVRRNGPLTLAALSELTHAAQPGLLQHLETLELYGTVARIPGEQEDQWQAVAHGLYFEIPDDPQGQPAGRALSSAMFLEVADLPAQWVGHDEVRLSLDWVMAAGLFNARAMVTPSELRGLQVDLERLLEPFTTRPAGLVPEGTAPVRALCFFMPEPRSGERLEPVNP